jgi:cytochrome b6-f complex iron-sulfur subunit
MDRRNFLSWVGVGALASSLPVALAACTAQKDGTGTSSESSSVASPAARADGFAPVGKVADLDAAGFVAAPKFAGGPVVVVRDPKRKDAAIAVNATCPHKGCVVDWKAEQQAFVCPCHAAAFGSDGAVKKGPAEQPLKSFTVKIEGDQVLVKA